MHEGPRVFFGGRDRVLPAPAALVPVPGSGEHPERQGKQPVQVPERWHHGGVPLGSFGAC